LKKKPLKSLLQEDHPFVQQGSSPKQRRKEVLVMKEYKVELEALHWMGMAFSVRVCAFKGSGYARWVS
jgi:hypothetical protein